jgi:hypothetical protein
MLSNDELKQCDKKCLGLPQKVPEVVAKTHEDY